MHAAAASRWSATRSWSRSRSAQAAIGISSDRQFLGLIGRVLPGWFPHLPEQSQYNRRLRGLVELISIVQQRLARWLDTGGVRLSDGTLVGVANYPGCQQRSEFAGFARYGFAKSQHRFMYGVRLVLLTDTRGLPLGYTIVRQREGVQPLADLLPAPRPPSWSPTKASGAATTSERLASNGTRCSHPRRPAPTSNLGRERALASTRLVIESVFPTSRADAARAPPRPDTAGLALRIAQRILALTIGMLLNTLAGRPARALAAYDGR